MPADVYRQKAPLLYGTALFSCPLYRLRKKSLLLFFKKILPCDQDKVSSQGLLSQRDEK
jgi:hypothetical protein